MGLDGFSIGVLGLNTDMTSAQMANQAEHLAQKGSEFKIKDVEESAQDQGVKRKNEEEQNQNQQEFNDGFKNEDDEHDLIISDANSLKEKKIENSNPKDFSVRINPLTDMIELFSNKEERVLETISAKDLMGLISKLNEASGVLVNRKI